MNKAKKQESKFKFNRQLLTKDEVNMFWEKEYNSQLIK